MKIGYFVPAKPMKVFDDNKKPLEITEEELLKTPFLPEEAGDTDGIVFLPNLETATEIALYDLDDESKIAFPIFIIGYPDDAPLDQLEVDAKLEDFPGGYAALSAYGIQVTLIYATLKHISDKFEDVILDEELYEEFQAQLKTVPAALSILAATTPDAVATPPSVDLLASLVAKDPQNTKALAMQSNTLSLTPLQAIQKDRKRKESHSDNEENKEFSAAKSSKTWLRNSI